MFEEGSENSVTFSDIHQLERAKHLQLLHDIEDKLYAEDFIPDLPEQLDESDSRYFYQQLENCVDDEEITTWRNNFPYFRVAGKRMKIEGIYNQPSESQGVSVSVVRDIGLEDYVLGGVDPEDTEDSEVTFAADGEEVELSSRPSAELSPLMRDMWPALVEALSPFVISVVRRRLASKASRELVMGRGSAGSTMSWETDSHSDQRNDGL